MSDFRKFLSLNVGFIAHQTAGYSREFPLELPSFPLISELSINDLTGVARVTRTSQGLLVQVKLSAHTPGECVRCLEPFDLPLEIEFTDLYAFTTDATNETELVLPENSIIDLGPTVRDEMLVGIPISPICQPDCKGLCPYCGENRNIVTCHHENEDIDPRLDTLKSLFEESD